MNIQADSEILVRKPAASPSVFPPNSVSAPSLCFFSSPQATNMFQIPPTDVKAAAAEKEQKVVSLSSSATCIPSNHQISSDQERKTAASSTSITTRDSTQPDAVVEQGKAAAFSSPASTVTSGHKISAHFNAKDADIILQSADNVLYNVHRKNLECAATGFPKAPANHTVVQMTEESDILDLLLDFTYPKPTPNIKDLSFKRFSKLASAAEKYKVYSAITICNIYMEANVKQYPIGVLRYAATYRYVKLLDTVAPIAIQERLGVVVSELPPEIAIVWVYYYQEWLDAVRDLTDPQKRPSSCTCTAWPSICLGILDRIGGKVESFFDLDRVFSKPTTGCLKCLSNINVWHNHANEMYANLHKFSELLFPKLPTGDVCRKSRTATPAPTSKTSVGDKTRPIPESAPATSIGVGKGQGLFQPPVTIVMHDNARATAPGLSDYYSKANPGVRNPKLFGIDYSKV